MGDRTASGEGRTQTSPGRALSAALDLPEPGALLGERYRIRRVIGAGGMGTVFEAETLSVGSRCAIKFLHAELAGRARSAWRFEREARLLAQLEHENITRVIDYGHYRERSPYFVMEYLNGDTLRKFVQHAGRMSLDQTLEIAKQTCRGMAYAHARGIVHRDLKPDNLMLMQRSDGTPWVKILDFGVARWALDVPAQLTPTGLDLGTAHYMSPEQARGAKDIDARTDVYAIGATLYELLAGRPLRPGQSYNEILFHMLTQPHEPLSAILPDCPAVVSELVERCLKQERSERPADCGELLGALESLPGSEGSASFVRAIPAAPMSSNVMASEHLPPVRWLRRSWAAGTRQLTGLVLGLCAGVLGTLLAQHVLRLAAPREQRAAETAETNALVRSATAPLRPKREAAHSSAAPAATTPAAPAADLARPAAPPASTAATVANGAAAPSTPMAQPKLVPAGKRSLPAPRQASTAGAVRAVSAPAQDAAVLAAPAPQLSTTPTGAPRRGSNPSAPASLPPVPGATRGFPFTANPYEPEP